MLPAYPRPHNHSPPQPFFLTDVDQWFNIRLPASLSSINYRHQIGTHYFLRRNPQNTKCHSRAATLHGCGQGSPKRPVKLKLVMLIV